MILTSYPEVIGGTAVIRQNLSADLLNFELHETDLSLVTCEGESVDGGYLHRRIVIAR